MKINVKKLNSSAVIPTTGSKYAAGVDLYFAAPPAIKLTIWSHKTELIPTGLAVEIPEGYFGAIFARSGLATKQGLRPANCVGVIDSDYRGQIKVALHNDTITPRTISGQERIAQLVIIPYQSILFEEVDELTNTERGMGGFGSTGK